jgi:serine/threonine-protein kinase
MPLAAGTRLGRYEVVRLLGAGGMGEVYLARDQHLDGKEVALKVLPAGALADDAARARFRKEAVALSKLTHPNIAIVYDFDARDGVDFLVMEYLPGETLDARLAVGPLPETNVARLGMQIAEGLAAAHKRGIVHRDLKPGNLQVTPEGHLKILDFGLAKLLPQVGDKSQVETATDSHAVSGTLPYMAPEQLRGENVDERTDIFALGAVLYEMATGKRPFREESSPRLIDTILNHPPVTPRAVNARVSPDLERIVLKCLEKDPTLRYQSATDVGVDLRRLGTPSGEAAVSPAVSPGSKWRAMGVMAALGGAAVLVLLIGLNVGGSRERLLGGTSPGRIESLAVLPLENLSRNPEEDYFADGMTEALISDLAQIGALRVISRTSAMRYKGTDKSLPQIARELNVDAIVEGSVMRAGERARITAQLIHAATDRPLWSKSYERDLRDVLALQREVARAIAQEIKIKLTPQEQTSLARAAPVDPEAHEAYLKGRHFLSKRTPKALRTGLEYFQLAIEKDPSYALAYAGLADAYNLLGDYLGPPKEFFPKAEAAAIRALEMDDTLAEAHASFGYVKSSFYWDWPGAEKEYKRAIELKPSYAQAHQWYAFNLIQLGRFDQAIAEVRRARELDPLSLIINSSAGIIFYSARKYDQAILAFKNALDMEYDFRVAHYYLGLVYVEKGAFEEGIAELQIAVDISERNPRYLSGLGKAYAAAGKRGDALAILDELEEMAERRYVQSINIAEVYGDLGEKDQAFAWSEKAYEARDWDILTLKMGPRFDSLRDDPRFHDLLRRIGLPPD